MDARKTKSHMDTSEVSAGELNKGYETRHSFKEPDRDYDELHIYEEPNSTDNINMYPVEAVQNGSCQIPVKLNSRKKKLICIGVIVALVFVVAICIAVAIAMSSRSAKTPLSSVAPDQTTQTGRTHSTGPIDPTGPIHSTGPIDSTDPTTAPPEMVRYASWTTWESWSVCSTSCGNGTKSRSRTCSVPKGGTYKVVKCKGKPSQEDPCTQGECPDCEHVCPDGGSMNENCTLCSCPGNDVTFVVKTPEDVPIQDVLARPANVAYLPPWISDANGRFWTTNLCPSELIVFTKEGFADVFATVGSDGSKNIIMQKLGKLNMLIDPKDMARLVGESVKFFCEASGNPPPTSFEWFLNDELLNSTMVTSNSTHSEVVLENLKQEHSGPIRCRANGINSAIYSNTASLKVEGTNDSFCDADPLEKLKDLPPDCPQDGSITYNIGTCGGEQCRKGVPGERDGQYCCGQSKTERRTLQCNDFSIDVLVTLECGCKLCQSNVGVMSYSDPSNDRVRFVGHVYDEKSKGPIGLADVYLFEDSSNSSNAITNTSLTGRFDFGIPEGISRIVLTIKDNRYKQYFDRSKVVHVTQTYGTIYHDIFMKKKTRVALFSSSGTQNAPVPIFGNNVEMAMDQTSFYSRGSRFNGNVGVTMDFINPRSTDIEEQLPGDMVYTNDEGELSDLRTFGMWQMEFADTNNNDLGAQGNVGIKISAEHIGASQGKSVKLWSMDPASGRWQHESNLQAGPISHTTQQSTYFFGNITLRGKFYYNVDIMDANYCFLRMEAYKNKSMNSPVTDWTSSKESAYKPRIISTNSAYTSRYGNLITGSRSRVWLTNIKSDRNCILTVCSENGQSRFDGYVSLENNQGPLTASDVLGGNPVSGVERSVDENNRSIKTTVFPTTLTGPIYQTSEALQCYNTRGTFCRNCNKEQHRRANPSCIFCDQSSCRLPSAQAYSECLKNQGNPNAPHYRFYLRDSHSYEYSFCKQIKTKDIMNACAEREDYPLIWYPLIIPNINNGKVTVWFIKVQVIRYNAETIVRAISKKTKPHNGKSNVMYGMRENITSSGHVCLEFKSSGHYLKSDRTYDIDATLVELHVQGSCYLSKKTKIMETLEVEPNASPFVFKIDTDHLPEQGKNSGLYSEKFDYNNDGNEDGPRRAREAAFNKCKCSSTMGVNCPEPIKPSGSGLVFWCSE